ncbi:MAG: Gmad2 immunoglobulin-like domain-containing protein [Nocardioides sp.]
MKISTRQLALGLCMTALGSALLAGCGDEKSPTAADPQTAAPTSASPSSETPPNETPTSPSSGGGTPDMVAAPVYFVGESPMGLRLYREFRQVEADNPAEEALALLLAGDVLDPDYFTLFDGLQLGYVDVRDDEIGVELGSGPYPRPDGMSRADAELALQSLVYTLQGVTQSRLPVQFEGDHDVAQEIYGIALDGPIQAAPQIDVVTLVNVTTPAHGQTLSGSFTAEGVANSFEATVPWKIIDSSGAVVAEYSAMAEGAYDRLYPWSTEIDVSDLPPGDYTFVALTDDPTGGEGPGAFQDTKAITIE